MNSILLMLSFGAIGVLTRYELQVYVAQRWPANAHWATLIVNVVGSFLMGAVYVIAIEKSQMSDEMRMAIMIGFLGGMTTFSSYALESIRLLEAENVFRTFFYVAFSPALAIAFCFLGSVVARKFA